MVAGVPPKADDGAPIHEPSRRDKLLDELRALEDAAVEAELETGRREETVEEAKRHIVVRVGRISLGVVVLLIGVALLALPGPGWLTIALGLGLLARDVPFARRLLERVRRRLPENESGEVSTRFIAVSVVVSAVLVMGSIWWSFLR